MTKIINFLKGKKSYIIAIVGAIITFCYIAGYMSKETYQVLMTLIGVGTIASVRVAIAGLAKK